MFYADGAMCQVSDPVQVTYIPKLRMTHLILSKDRRSIDSLLEVFLGELDLVGNRTTVDLDLHQVGLFLGKTGLSDLGVCEDTDDGAILGDTFELPLDGLSTGFRVLLGVLGEGLFLGSVPVLVEATAGRTVEAS